MVEVSPSLRFYLDEVPFSSTQSVKEKRKIKDPQKIPQIHKPKPTTKKQTQKTKIPFTKIGYRERERGHMNFLWEELILLKNLLKNLHVASNESQSIY